MARLWVQIGVNLLLAKWVDATDDNTEKKFLFAYVLTAGAFACIAAARCISMTVLSVRASTNLHARCSNPPRFPFHRKLLWDVQGDSFTLVDVDRGWACQ